MIREHKPTPAKTTTKKVSIAFLGIVALMISVAAESTRACFVCPVTYQSLLDQVESSQQVVVVRAIEVGPLKWQVVRVLRSSTNMELKPTESIKNSDQMTLGDFQLLRRKDETASWTNEGVIDQELLSFLTAAVALSSKKRLTASLEDPAQSLRYFLPYLEHQNPQIADSAFYKISRAPYKEVRKLGKHLKPDELLELLENPHLASKRRSLYITLLGCCGGERESLLIKNWIDQQWKTRNSGNLAALIAAHVELEGEKTVQFIEQAYLQNRDRKLAEIIEAIDALRVHGEADAKLPRARIQASFHLFLKERPPLLELIIEDFARWKDWSIAPKLMELYAAGQQPWNNAMIIKYLEACPLPAAKQFVRRESGALDR